MDNMQQKIKHLELVQILKEAKETFLMRTELFAVVALELKAKYEALVSAGFTQDQALELIKHKAL